MTTSPRADRVALVTGGGRGVGRAVAVALAEAGLAVGVTARSGDELDDTVTHITRLGGRAFGVVGDITRREDVARVVAGVEGELGPIDVCVANAGRFAASGRIWEQDPDEWWGDVEVNLRGPLLTLHAVLPGMVERAAQGRAGTVVTVSSGIGTRPNPWASAYAAGKAALFRLTDSVAGELAGTGVSAFVISPGLVRTAMTDWPTEFLRWYPEWADIPENDFVDAERAGALVARLASGGFAELSGRYLHVGHDLDALRAIAASLDDEGTLRMVAYPAP
ncbi:MAG: SDR family oxidoreductase [Actinomycetota bacterium]|nr:SDR family oxidoreductase [Actinomycetota bacterium]